MSEPTSYLEMKKQRDEALAVRDRAREASNRDLMAKRAAEWLHGGALEPRVASWVISRIGPDHMQSRERAMRSFEENCELAQSEGITKEQVLAQVEHVYSRPAGEPQQEAGGVAVCLLAWCAANGLSLADIAVAELERIEAKPLDQIRGSLARKADADLVVAVEHDRSGE